MRKFLGIACLLLVMLAATPANAGCLLSALFGGGPRAGAGGCGLFGGRNRAHYEMVQSTPTGYTYVRSSTPAYAPSYAPVYAPTYYAAPAAAPCAVGSPCSLQSR